MWKKKQKLSIVFTLKAVKGSDDEGVGDEEDGGGDEEWNSNRDSEERK